MRTMAACGAVLIVACAASAQAPVAPSDPWTLGQTPEYCYLSRTLAAGGQNTDVLIQSFGSTSPYHFAIRSAALPLRPQRAEVAKIGFGRDPQDVFTILGKWNGVATAIFAGSTHKVEMNGSIYVYQSTDARPGIAVDPAGGVLTIETPDAAPLNLALGSMTDEYARLDACTQTLEAKWVAAASGGSVPAKAPELLHPGETNWHMK